MRHKIRIACLLMMGTVVAACSDQGQAPVAQMPSADNPSETTHRAGQTILALSADDVRIQTTVGQRVPGQGLVANGAEGYLTFGPYTALDSGKYTLTVFGTLNVPAPQNAVVVDVVHDKGGVVDGKIIFDRGSGEEGGQSVLTKLDFDMKQPAQDVEFRVLLKPGAHVTLTGYKVVADD